MEKIVKKLTEEKITFDLPCFVQFTERICYKIINEHKILMVKDFDFTKEISFQDYNQLNPFCNSGWEFIAEEKFNEVFTKVFYQLEELLPKVSI